MSPTMRRCYPASGSALRTAGCVLLAAGAVVLFVCTPCWVWCALSGVVLIALGLVLVNAGGGWR